MVFSPIFIIPALAEHFRWKKIKKEMALIRFESEHRSQEQRIQEYSSAIRDLARALRIHRDDTEMLIELSEEFNEWWQENGAYQDPFRALDMLERVAWRGGRMPWGRERVCPTFGRARVGELLTEDEWLPGTFDGVRKNAEVLDYSETGAQYVKIDSGLWIRTK
jgi:hypothetical protein